MRDKLIAGIIFLLVLQLGALAFYMDISGKIHSIDNNDQIPQELIHQDTQIENLRVSIIENVGQFDDWPVQYYALTDTGYIGFGEDCIYFWTRNSDQPIILRFLDSKNSNPVGVDIRSYYSNYLLGERGTYKNIRNYDSVVYYDIWPGINLRSSASQFGIAYEFQNLEKIDEPSFEYEIEVDGEKRIETITSESGQWESLFDGLSSCNICLTPEFILPAEEIPFNYSTYVGGSNRDRAYSSSMDSAGCVYVTGSTISSNFPTVNAYDSSFNYKVGGYTNDDCFVFKLNATGNGLLYSTYIGGLDSDTGFAIDVDSEGCAYVTGETSSYDFPIIGPIWSEGDCFVLKLNEYGNALNYSTYLDSSSWIDMSDIAVDETGNAYVLGSTISGDFPTVNAFCDVNSGGRDIIVFKMNAAGNGFNYSTYFGGADDDYPYSILLDSSNNAYVVGQTSSENIHLQNPYDSIWNGNYDGFIFKLNASGSSLIFSTYYGGSGDDTISSVALDETGNILLCGYTTSSDFPTKNAYNDTLSGYIDGFVFKMNPTATEIEYSTYLGGRDSDRCTSITTDLDGNAIVAGWTTSDDFPTTDNYQTTYHGTDCFIVNINSAGNGISSSILIGGTGEDYPSDIYFDSLYMTTLVGSTTSTNFPVFNPFQSVNNGNYDCFALKIEEMELIEDTTTTTTTTTSTTSTTSTTATTTITSTTSTTTTGTESTDTGTITNPTQTTIGGLLENPTILTGIILVEIASIAITLIILLKRRV